MQSIIESKVLSTSKATRVENGLPSGSCCIKSTVSLRRENTGELANVEGWVVNLLPSSGMRKYLSLFGRLWGSQRWSKTHPAEVEASSENCQFCFQSHWVGVLINLDFFCFPEIAHTLMQTWQLLWHVAATAASELCECRWWMRDWKKVFFDD